MTAKPELSSISAPAGLGHILVQSKHAVLGVFRGAFWVGRDKEVEYRAVADDAFPGFRVEAEAPTAFFIGLKSIFRLASET